AAAASLPVAPVPAAVAAASAAIADASIVIADVSAANAPAVAIAAASAAVAFPLLCLDERNSARKRRTMALSTFRPFRSLPSHRVLFFAAPPVHLQMTPLMRQGHRPRAVIAAGIDPPSGSRTVRHRRRHRDDAEHILKNEILSYCNRPASATASSAMNQPFNASPNGHHQREACAPRLEPRA
ncbi:MAG: hypothetical protein J2P53_15790, partial [Bradyrhizobiaceae bacterium]|nr:hypothetical protein [Bradyrhizobiaceae bacterium]